jgi:hypothetical protein
VNLKDVGQEIHDRLNTIEDLQTYLGPPGSVNVPCAVVVLPELINYDETYARGADKITWPVLLLAGRVEERLVLDRIGIYCDGSGDSSVKAVLEDPAYTYTSCDSVHVTKVQLDIVTWKGTDFQGALFELSIFGSGA